MSSSGATHRNIALLAYHWFQSLDYWDRITSLNLRQTSANPDGTITYFISTKDTGLNNWLDTYGCNKVSIMCRWQTECFSCAPTSKFPPSFDTVKRSEYGFGGGPLGQSVDQG
jgi:hypothetical protein